jgi:hypothetical protein
MRRRSTRRLAMRHDGDVQRSRCRADNGGGARRDPARVRGQYPRERTQRRAERRAEAAHGREREHRDRQQGDAAPPGPAGCTQSFPYRRSLAVWR